MFTSIRTKEFFRRQLDLFSKFTVIGIYSAELFGKIDAKLTFALKKGPSIGGIEGVRWNVFTCDHLTRLQGLSEVKSASFWKHGLPCQINFCREGIKVLNTSNSND